MRLFLLLCLCTYGLISQAQISSLPKGFSSGELVWYARTGLSLNGITGPGVDDEKTNWAAEKCYGEFKNILGGSLTVGADMPIGNSPFYIGISISGSMRGYEKSMRWKEGTSLLRSQTERLTAFNAQISPMNIGYIAKLSKNTALDFHVGCFFSYDMAATLSSETVFNDDSMDKDSYDISYLKDHGNYTIYDIGFNGGAGLWFNHWIIDFSYQRGIASMFNNGNDFYSKKVQLSLGYAF
jgi:hypothetical protein